MAEKPQVSTLPGLLRALVGLLNVLVLLAQPAGAETAEPLAPLPLTVPGDPAKIALGERLFHEQRLSSQGRFSCASCHPLERGGMDGRTRAEGVNGVKLRNVPSLFNTRFNYFLNWDGRVTTLEAHAEQLLANPKVMDSQWPAVQHALEADPEYVRAFSALYPDGLTKANILDSLAEFERSLITPNARFDRYLRGDKTALDAAEQEGYRLFKSLGCVACHQGLNIGGNLFQKFGVFAKPQSGPADADPGRFASTQDERDKGVYRVPSLRNVAVTAPYFHDGRAATLEEAVDTMAQQQLGKSLSTKERGLIVRFLQTLTGEYQGKLLSRGEAKTR
jgi:cytochrome c peroxidase